MNNLTQEERLQRLIDLVRRNLTGVSPDLESTVVLTTLPSLATDMAELCDYVGHHAAVVQWKSDLPWQDQLDDIEKQVLTTPVILTLTQQQLASDFTKLANWKNHFLLKIGQHMKDSVPAVGHLFIVVTIDEPSTFEYGDAKSIANIVFNVDVEY